MSEKATCEELEQKIKDLEQKIEFYKDIEESLNQSEKKFREIIEDVSGISIQGYDENRAVVFWNQASEKIYGYTEKEALGKKLEDLIIPPAMRETVKHLHHRWVVHGEKIPSGELRLMDKNGKDVDVFSSHVMSDTLNGKEMFCIDIDLAPIKKSEEEKKQLQEQLIKSQKMEAIGTLTSGIAHDFNNILQMIGGFTDYLILKQSEDDAIHTGLEKIRSAADRAMELVRQLMLFSRKTPPVKKSVSINHEVEQACKLMRKTIARMITIETTLLDTVWNVKVDSVQIEQMILNLGINAADAMPDGGTISIKTANTVLDREPSMEKGQEALSGNYVKISLSDTGHGIEQPLIAKIFDPFFTTKPSGKGTGLGLSSVYGIVKRHGGMIQCNSEVNQGTIFKIYLPAVKNDSPYNISPGMEMSLQQGTETILMVDDEVSIREFGSKALQLFGYTFMGASSGEEALAIHDERGEEIDLTILDINMPGMGGYKCLKQLLQKDSSMKIIVSSGYPENPIIQKHLDMGALKYLNKPYKISEMMAMIRNVLDRDQ